MEQNVDKRGRLEEEPFSYRISKDNKVFISCNGRLIKTLNGTPALAFIEKIESADSREAQLIMAKATGNFKHGNEKLAKQKRMK